MTLREMAQVYRANNEPIRLRLREGGLLQVTASQHALAMACWEEIAQRLGADFPQLKLDDTPRPSRED